MGIDKFLPWVNSESVIWELFFFGQFFTWYCGVSPSEHTNSYSVRKSKGPCKYFWSSLCSFLLGGIIPQFIFTSVSLTLVSVSFTQWQCWASFGSPSLNHRNASRDLFSRCSSRLGGSYSLALPTVWCMKLILVFIFALSSTFVEDTLLWLVAEVHLFILCSVLGGISSWALHFICSSDHPFQFNYWILESENQA